MVFTSIASVVLFVAAGVLLVLAAFHSEEISAWESRAARSMADALGRLRASLEAQEALANAEAPTQNTAAPVVEAAVTAELPAPPATTPQPKRNRRGNAA